MPSLLRTYVNHREHRVHREELILIPAGHPARLCGQLSSCFENWIPKQETKFKRSILNFKKHISWISAKKSFIDPLRYFL